MKPVQDLGERVANNLEKVLVGKRHAVDLIVIGLLCQGHVLIEDVPGVGKTVLARSLARSLDCAFSRIQFTPDMLPSDVTGVSVFNQLKQLFEFRPGPLFGSVVLADEINRATPKTQAALLEAMEEHQVTVDGTTHALPTPFLVLATQNPIEYEGTFPLPEAQLDRFLMRLRIGYPSVSDEIRVLEEQQIKHPLESLTAVATAAEVLQAVATVRHVFLSPAIKRYIVDLTTATRRSSDVYLGASPRGSLGLARAGQARAALDGRDYVLPDDVQNVAVAILGHRLIISPEARLRDLSSDQIVREILHETGVPGGAFVPAGSRVAGA